MLPLGRNGFSSLAVKAALHGKGGSRQIQFRFDLIRNGAPVRQLPVSAGEIRYSAGDSIQRTARFELSDDSRINWLTDLIKPFMLVGVGNGWAEFPLGVFVPSTPTKLAGNGVHWSVEAYDRSAYAREDCTIDRMFYPAGTGYLNIVQELLLSSGILDVVSLGSPPSLPTDREWDIGTSKLEIINELLREINYCPLSVNADGAAVLAPYRQPSADTVTYTYRADELSVISTEAESVTDLYSVPNVFIAVVSNPEMEPLRAVYVNDNPSSELSTIRRGRNIVSELYKPDVITGQEELEAYIRRVAFEQSQVYETVTIRTALMPIHESGEVLEIRHPNINGVYEEIGWEMDLRAGGEMTHTVRRIVQI